jgi:molybdopterin molybdotransferase
MLREMSTPLITVAQARELVLQSVRPLGTEPVEIDAALGRVLAADILAADDVPPFACSAMDGYAVQAGGAGRRLSVIGESRAGAPSPADRPLGPDEAIRISTGAAVPAGATAVIPQENVTGQADTVQPDTGQAETGRADTGQADTGQADQIKTEADTAPGQNIRGPGEDMRAQTVVLRAGTRLESVELGAAVAAGAGSVTVARRPRVSVLCTGDELRAPGAALGPGEIHNSNAPMLIGLAANAGAQTNPAERLPDDHAATRAGIASALETSDVLIISGGVSVGPHDHVKAVLAELGVTEVFWSVALQPGKPTWFGTLDGGRLVFGLPGNPVSVVVTFSLFVAPALARLQGRTTTRTLGPEAVLGTEVKRNPRREQAVRVRLERGDGPPVATPNGAQGSHILTSLIGADALAMIPAGDGTLAAGTVVALEPLAT